MVTKTRMTLAEFLALPEEKPYLEFVDGEVVQKAMPTESHGVLVAELIRLLGNHLREARAGRVATEVRHVSRALDWVFLPDVSVTLGDRQPSQSSEPVDVTPDFAIEVLSPDDRPGRLFERVDLYLRSGVKLLWLVDPETKSIMVYRPGDPQVAVRSGTLRAEPVLPGFSLDVGELFAELSEE